MKILKKDLKFIKSGAWSRNKFPYSFYQSGFEKGCSDIMIGRWKIALLAQGDNLRFYLFHGYNRGYKTKDYAIKYLLRKLNSETVS